MTPIVLPCVAATLLYLKTIILLATCEIATPQPINKYIISFTSIARVVRLLNYWRDVAISLHGPETMLRFKLLILPAPCDSSA